MMNFKNSAVIANSIAVLLYKESPALLEKIDFEDENTFLEPLLSPILMVKLNHKFKLIFRQKNASHREQRKCV